MRRFPYFLLATLAVPVVAAAQTTRTPRVELIPTFGYMSSGSLSTAVGRLDLEDGLVYGGTLAFRTGGGKSILLNYTYFGTDLKATDRVPIAPDTVLGGMAQHNITIGGEQDLKSGHARPFLSGALGLVIFDSDVRGASGSSTRFTMHAAVGFKAMSQSERVGVKIQAKFQFNTVSSDGGFWCGNYGCGAGVTTSGIMQFEPSAGLVIAF
jgi:hypothetical protein